MSPRHLVLSVVLLLGTTVVPLSGEPAAAGAVMCQGREATLVGSAGEPLIGTDGPDVIITNGASVDARGGDDVICAHGLQRSSGGSVPVVLAGDGDDAVVVTQPGAYHRLEVVLGDGDDMFVGGDGADWVKNRHDGEDAPSGGVDSVDTRAGNDHVDVGGEVGTLVDDDVDLGAGDDTIYLSDGVPAGGALTAGPGRDRVALYCGGRELVVTAADSSATCDDVAWPMFSSVEDYAVSASSVRFTGTAQSEELDVTWTTGRLEVDLRGGDDHFVITVGGAVQGSVALGGGRDLVDVDRFGEDVVVDLSRGVVRRRSTPAEDALRITGAEDAALRAAGSTLIGDAGPNRLYATCTATPVRGAGGDDVLRPLPAGADRHCPLTQNGGRGDDVLLGASGRDVLLGGPGRDRAVGRDGIDRCVAEARRGCER